MRPSLVFFGGCTGIGKSRLLRCALEKFSNKEYTIVNISEHFKRCRQNDTGDENANIIWHREHWKEYDKRVRDSLHEAISKSGKQLVIINQHFATISPSGYLPGIDLDTLDVLLEQHLDLNQPGSKDSVMKTKKTNVGENADGGKKCSFGVLLIDTDPDVMLSSYNKQLGDGDKSILGYVSNESILKDLEENRKWAGIYSNRALSVLGESKVFSDTIYIHDLAKQTQTIDEIAAFFRQFGLTKQQ